MAYHPYPSFWQAATPAARDLAYDNTRAVADSAQLIARRNQEAAAFRAAHAGQLDLAYGPGERNRWDIFPGQPGAPCLVFVHGGYWQRNRREDFCGFMAGVMAAGWSAALPGYTLCPDITLTGLVAELHAALDWLAANGAAHGVSGPVVLSGWSAGGHLAAMAAGHPRVAAALAVSGIYELAPIRDTALNDALHLSLEECATLSPMRLPVVDKPVCVAYGSAELPELRRQSRDFHSLRAEAHAPGVLLPVKHADHFRILESFKTPDGVLARAAMDLVK